jgi:hypothetical protein
MSVTLNGKSCKAVLRHLGLNELKRKAGFGGRLVLECGLPTSLKMQVLTLSYFKIPTIEGHVCCSGACVILVKKKKWIFATVQLLSTPMLDSERVSSE